MIDGGTACIHSIILRSHIYREHFMYKAIFLAILFSLPTSASADPSVFVRSDRNMAWWGGTFEARIIGQQAGNVTTKKLSDYLEKEMVFSPYAICSLKSVDSTTFVGLDKETQEEIAATLPHVSWRQLGKTPDGQDIAGQVVLFEGCDKEDPRGAALLVTDIQSSEILKWLPIGNTTGEKGGSEPTWVMFMEAGQDGELFAYSGCTECGARTSVYYDVTRKRVYTEYNGH
jgi:hypothetical protein